VASSSLADSLRETLALFDTSGAPQTTVEVAQQLDLGRRSTSERLEQLVDHGELETKTVGTNGRVWWQPLSSPEPSLAGRLERIERWFEAMFEDPNLLVGLLEPDGTVVDLNGTAMEYIDADLEAVIGEPFWETPRWGEEIRADVVEWTERAAAGEYVDFEADLVQPDGEQYTVNGVCRPVTNDDGDVVSIIVTERERELERYETIVEEVTDGVYVVGEDGTFTMVNHDRSGPGNSEPSCALHWLAGPDRSSLSEARG
jgi:PAS domain-containing protein